MTGADDAVINITMKNEGSTTWRRFSLAALFGRGPQADRAEAQRECLLSPNAVAFVLQPHMPNRHALAWLAAEQNGEPNLSCVVRDGEVFYRLSDVEAFIQRLPKPPLATARPFRERRCGRSRRDQRSGIVARERRITLYRRCGFDRRGGVDRRQVRDDFGYGRGGDRRMPTAVPQI